MLQLSMHAACGMLLLGHRDNMQLQTTHHITVMADGGMTPTTHASCSLYISPWRLERM